MYAIIDNKSICTSRERKLLSWHICPAGLIRRSVEPDVCFGQQIFRAHLPAGLSASAFTKWMRHLVSLGITHVLAEGDVMPAAVREQMAAQFILPSGRQVLWEVLPHTIARYAKFCHVDLYRDEIGIVADRVDGRLARLTDCLSRYVKAFYLIPAAPSSVFSDWQEEVMREYGISVLCTPDRRPPMVLNLADTPPDLAGAQVLDLSGGMHRGMYADCSFRMQKEGSALPHLRCAFVAFACGLLGLPSAAALMERYHLRIVAFHKAV